MTSEDLSDFAIEIHDQVTSFLLSVRRSRSCCWPAGAWARSATSSPTSGSRLTPAPTRTWTSCGRS
ncbi:MAG: hypothetical protein AUG49_04820 [Catenulispora sp. 13_1_20CM_3_70_7]|nr:MAG: hypothetical protein AUG49_04820 [Catenulispora sp. 13_1_20CM_3_70_7]